LLRKKITLPMMLLVLAVAVTGCGVTPEGTLDRSGIWGTFVGFISDALEFFYELTMDYGIAILLLTLAVRIVIFPLMMKQIRYQKVMQALQPELQKIREKYKDDREKTSQETMKLFQQHNANPLAGCFPILLQMPILFALFQAINYHPTLKEHEFLGFMSLAATNSIDNIVLAALAAITTYIQSKMTMANTNDPNMKMMLYIMPAMIAFFTYTFPTALGLYWFFGNVLTIIQTYFTRGLRNAPADLPAAGTKGKSAQSGGQAKGKKK